MVHDYRRQLEADVALWSVDGVTSCEVIRLACDALVSGLDSQALRELAGASPSSPAYDIEDLLERVAIDFELTFHGRHSEGGQLAAARVMAAQCVAGELPPRELARWMHSRIQHGHDDQRVEALVYLDDRYDVREHTGESLDQIDVAVMNAAKYLLRPE